MPVSQIQSEELSSHLAHLTLALSSQAYHSAYNDEPDARLLGSMTMLPLRTKVRGPAPPPGEYPNTPGQRSERGWDGYHPLD